MWNQARLGDRLAAACEYNPFSILGLHSEKNQLTFRVWRPGATQVAVQFEDTWLPLAQVNPEGLFVLVNAPQIQAPWQLIVDGVLEYDPYAFLPTASKDALYWFAEGRHTQAYRLLGAEYGCRNTVWGTCFRVWAPNAERVSVIGSFNQWDGRRHPMGNLGPSGVWELFLPNVTPGMSYRFELLNRDSQQVMRRADPYARQSELRPNNASIVAAVAPYPWQDQAWLDARRDWDWLHQPINIYEVHLGSWRRHGDARFYHYDELAQTLIPYAKNLGYTHLELMPLTEHPLDESWGYQTTGYFAPSARYGAPEALKRFVEACHQAGLGVILDWVPGHFPQDEWALAHFDGSPLYEHEDPRMKCHPDWGTYVFNYGRNEVRSFLLSSAHWWLSEFHFDGLRVDAVASMLYLDYSRAPGQWLPNRHGGRENLEAIDFLQQLNVMVHGEFPGALTIAEESTAWPMVSRPTYLGGLGFSLKWNMGWMNDTLAYTELDPIFRRYHHHRLTFGQMYAYSENFVLPLSHDEVVHGKRSLCSKMPGDEWQRHAQLRLLFGWQLTCPGKKLHFMGSEFAQQREWNCSEGLDWNLLDQVLPRGVHQFQKDLNHLYRTLPALHQLDSDPAGFAWIDCHDAEQSVISYLRYDQAGNYVVVVLNFTPVPRHHYSIGVPHSGEYRELVNSDAECYGGSNWGNYGCLSADSTPWMGQPARLQLTLPPFGVLILQPRLRIE